MENLQDKFNLLMEINQEIELILLVEIKNATFMIPKQTLSNLSQKVLVKQFGIDQMKDFLLYKKVINKVLLFYFSKIIFGNLFLFI